MDSTAKFDLKVLELLRTIKGVEVFDIDVEDSDAPAYIVFHGGAEIGAFLTSNQSIAGHQYDVYEHRFDIKVVATQKSLLVPITSKVKQLLIGATLIPGSSGVNIAPSLSMSGDYDATMRPTKFLAVLSFAVSLDRSADEIP